MSEIAAISSQITERVSKLSSKVVASCEITPSTPLENALSLEATKTNEATLLSSEIKARLEYHLRASE